MNTITKRNRFFIFLTLLATGLLCTTVQGNEISQEKNAVLKVGIAPDYPPLAFKQGEETVGIEVDLANMLAEELTLPLRLVELTWNDLIPALLDGRINIIMSGMSITRGRKVRITFSNPYYELGQMALIRQADVGRLGTTEKITTHSVRIGVIKGTTGDVFVQHQCPDAKKVMYAEPKDAAWDLGLNRKQIDVFIYDAPAIYWYASENEADLTVVKTPFTREFLAWGLRRNDVQLLTDVNAVLKKSQEDGRVEKIINRWIPQGE